MLELTGLTKTITDYDDLGHFTSRMISAVQPLVGENPALTKLVSRCEDELSVVRAILNATPKDAFTKLKFGQDGVRDIREKGFGFQVDAWTCRDKKPAEQQAAKELNEVLTRIGPAYHKGYKKQSELTDRIRTEMDKPENQAKINLLGIGEWYSEWIESEDDFKGIVARSSAAEKKELPHLIKAYNTLFDCVKLVLDYLQAMVAVEPESYTDVCVEINNITDQIMAAARARETRKRNNEAEDEQEQVQPVDTDGQNSPEA